MKRTSLTLLVMLAIGAGTLGWLLEIALVATGRPAVVLPFTFALALLVIQAAVIIAAIPVRKVARRYSGAKVDPIYATRVLLLAKAAAVMGALLTGATVAGLVFLLTRPVLGAASLIPAMLAALASVGLLVCGLVAENMCRIPPQDDEEHHGQAPSTS